MKHCNYYIYNQTEYIFSEEYDIFPKDANLKKKKTLTK